MGVNYVCLAGKRDPASTVGILGNENIFVDINALEAILEKIDCP
jgi:hypothetical protein